jgi:CRP/FNR family transcriptional regulator
LTGNALDRLDRLKTRLTYSPGQGIFYQGEPGLTVLCIRSGRIRQYKHGPNGEELVIRVVDAGGVLGDRAVLAEEPHATSAEAIEKTDVCIITKEVFHELLIDSPELARDMLHRLAREIRISEDLMMDLTQKPVRQRLIDHLLMFHSEAGSKSQQLPSAGAIKRKDMARMIGTTPETLSRALRELTNEGYVSVTRSEIRVCDLDGLARLSVRDDLLP